jgi:hypothetical protein
MKFMLQKLPHNFHFFSLSPTLTHLMALIFWSEIMNAFSGCYFVIFSKGHKMTLCIIIRSTNIDIFHVFKLHCGCSLTHSRSDIFWILFHFIKMRENFSCKNPLENKITVESECERERVNLSRKYH